MSIAIKELIDGKKAIKILGCSEGSFKNYIAKGYLRPHTKVSGKNFFCIDTVKRFSPPSKERRSIPSPKKSKGIDTHKMRDVIDKWKITSYDTSSCDIYIGMYTEKISQLEAKMKSINHEKLEFFKMRKYLVKYVCERRRLLSYLQSTDHLRYKRALKLMKQ